MSFKETPCIRKVYWKDVRERVAKLQPGFARLVDGLDPGKEYPLYIVKYKYGDLIVDEGLAHLPQQDGSLIAINDPNLPTQLRKDLGYGDFRIPAGIVFHNAMELSITACNRVLPWKYYSEGVIFGLGGYLERGYLENKPNHHPARVFTITAGARSIFLLPCIGDVAYHDNLERMLRCRFPIAKNLIDQHRLFVKLVNHEHFQSEWNLELMFFSRKWVEKINSGDGKWSSLRLFLLDLAWTKISYWRNQHFYDLAFSRAQFNRPLKSNPYLVDTAKHLVTMAGGYVPGFVPAISDQAAPVSLLQKIFVDVYRIKYLPIIMRPYFFDPDSSMERPVYYSLQFPTAWEFSPHSKKYVVTLQDLKELWSILSNFCEEMCGGNLKVEDTPIKAAIDVVDFDFFHLKGDGFYNIHPTSTVSEEDPNLEKVLVDAKGKPFPFAAPFLRGSVRIAHSK